MRFFPALEFSSSGDPLNSVGSFRGIIFFPGKRHIPVSYRCSADAKVNGWRCEKKRRYGACERPRRENGNRRTARRGSEAWRISLSDVSNYVYVSAPPSRAIPLVPGVWLHRDVGRPVRRKEMHLPRPRPSSPGAEAWNQRIIKFT